MSCRLSPPLSGEREGQRSPRVVLDTILGTLDAVAVVNTADQLFTIRSFLSRNYCESFRPNVYLPFLSVIKRRKRLFPLFFFFFSLSRIFERGCRERSSCRRGRLRFLDCIIDLLMSRGTY